MVLFWAQCFINVVDNISVNIYRGPYNNRGAAGNTLKISGNRWFLCGSCVTHYRQPWHQLFFLPCSTKNGLKNVTKYFRTYLFIFPNATLVAKSVKLMLYTTNLELFHSSFIAGIYQHTRINMITFHDWAKKKALIICMIIYLLLVILHGWVETPIKR